MNKTNFSFLRKLEEQEGDEVSEADLNEAVFALSRFRKKVMDFSSKIQSSDVLKADRYRSVLVLINDAMRILVAAGDKLYGSS